jgi:hypothetical protein
MVELMFRSLYSDSDKCHDYRYFLNFGFIEVGCRVSVPEM